MAAYETGRPHKFDEPLVRKQFELPESLNTELLKRTARHRNNPSGLVDGPDQAEFMRDAIKAYLENSVPVSIDDVIARTVRTMLEEEGVRVAIDKRERSRLERIAAKSGFADVTDYLKSFVRRALAAPDDVEAFLKNPARKQAMERVARNSEPAENAA